jgi:hypothetical protein
MLYATCIHLIRVHNLIIEVDASYIKDMLSNPDIQPNATINRWIATILLFDFKLIHIPTEKHKGPNRLSRCKPAPGKEEDDNDPEDWVDSTLTLRTWVVSWLDTSPINMPYTDTLVLSLDTTLNNEDSV